MAEEEPAAKKQCVGTGANSSGIKNVHHAIAAAAAQAVPLPPVDDSYEATDFTMITRSGAMLKEMTVAINRLQAANDADRMMSPFEFMAYTGFDMRFHLPSLNYKRLKDALLEALTPDNVTPLREFLNHVHDTLRYFPATEVSRMLTPRHIEDAGIRAIVVVLVWRLVNGGKEFWSYLVSIGSRRKQFTEAQTAKLTDQEWIANFPHNVFVDMESEDERDYLGLLFRQAYMLDALRILQMMTNMEGECDFFLEAQL